ncbi:MAG: porin family protein [candidate division Zixibacteria bacterium]|nr:porin family protein [candidate division Zixibacteria bacterium]
MAKKLLLLLLAILCFATLPAAAQEGSVTWNNRHHIGLVIGYAKLLSDDVKDDSSGLDWSNSAHAAVTYRYSVNPNLDLAVDSRATFSTQTVNGVDVNLTNTYFGPGVRVIAPQGKIKLFLQGNIYFVNEEVELVQGNTKVSGNETDVGFGANCGIDIQVSKLLSIPLEANFLYAKPVDNVSAFGISAGLTFNFGMML